MSRLLKTRPRGYQARGAQLFIEQETAALFMDTRTGKTLTSLLALVRLWRGKSLRRVVVFCPKSAITVWKRQARTHLNIPYTVSTLDHIETDPDALNFLLVNYEVSWRVPQADVITQFLAEDPNSAALCDESHRIGNGKSRQSKGVWLIGQAAKYRACLTGTPTDEDEIDLWGQFRFLKPELLGFEWKGFERRWLRKAGYGGYDRKIKKHKREELYKILSPYTFVIKRSEVMDVPEVDEYVIPVPLSGEARRVYRELEDELRTEIADEIIVTPMRVQQMIKLQQVAGGFLNTEDAVIHLEQDKLAMLRDWLHDFRRKKFVIFARFTAEIKALETVLGQDYRVSVLAGHTKDRTIWERFQYEKHPQGLIVQEKTGGESIELSVADVGASYSKSWSFRNFKQCKDRLIGRKRALLGHFVGEGTIDEDILDVVHAKGHSAKAVLSKLKRRKSHG